jgi:hypothetical protein
MTMRAKLTYSFAQSALNLHDNLVPNSKTLFLFSPDKQFKLPLMSVPPCTFALFYNIMFWYKWHAGIIVIISWWERVGRARIRKTSFRTPSSLLIMNAISARFHIYNRLFLFLFYKHALQL